MNDPTSRGTRVHQPDLDWSQVRETVLMLELSVGQIEAAMKDSNASVEVLTNSFTTMADTLSRMTEAIAALPDKGKAGAAKEDLKQSSDNVSGLVHQAIIAFQFYDKLVQRLSHVNHSLGALSDLVADRVKIFNPQEWAALQGVIRSKYTMREEQAMFDAVMRGMPVQEAIEHFMAEMKDKASDDVELF